MLSVWYRCLDSVVVADLGVSKDRILCIWSGVDVHMRSAVKLLQ